MKVYDVQAFISGINQRRDDHRERIVASGLQQVCELLAAVCRDTGSVILELHIVETDDQPFSHRTRKT